MTTTTTSSSNTRYLDKMDPTKNCPGFNLWEVLATDGETYLMASDNTGGLETRLFFRTDGNVHLKSATLLGPNPDVALWDSIRSAR